MLRGLGACGVVLVLLAGCSSGAGLTVEDGAATIIGEVTQLQDTPVDGVGDAAVAWTGEVFVVTGGVVGTEKFGADGEPETDDDGPIDTLSDDEADVLSGGMPTHAYDPDTGSWRELAAAPLPARSRHVAVWTGTELLVWGGTPRRNGVGGLLDAAAWDPDTDTWRTLPSSPAGTDRSFAEAAVIGPYVVIGGGAGPSSDSDGNLLVLDTRDDSWAELDAGGSVVDLHADDGGAVHLLRAVATTVDGALDAYSVERLLVSPDGTLDVEPVGPTLPEPSTLADAPAGAFPASVGLVGTWPELWVVAAPANMTAVVYGVPAGTDAETGSTVAAAEVEGLAGTSRLNGHRVDPTLVVDGAALSYGEGWAPTVAWVLDGSPPRARRVEVGEAACLNSRAHAVAGDAVLFVAGDCVPELVRFAPTTDEG